MTQESRFWTGITTGDAGPYSFEDMNEIFRYFVGDVTNPSGIFYQSGALGAAGLVVTQNAPPAANVLVSAGAALVHGSFYKSTANETLSIAANSSGNPRIDSIVLTKLWATQTVRLEVLQGTPAGSPVAPTLTETDNFKWQFKIADIAVANGFATITTSDISNQAASTVGAIVTPAVSPTIPAYTTYYGSTATTASATFVDTHVDAALTMNITGTKIFFVFSAYCSPAGGGYGYYNLYDSEVGYYAGDSVGGQMLSNASYLTLTMSGIFTGLTPGSHTLQPKHRSSTGNLNTLYTSIVAMEVS